MEMGGGGADNGLSDQALIWMIARVHALTGLEFNEAAVKSNTKPNLGGGVEDSTEGLWLLDHYFPHYRVILSPVAIDHGYLINSKNPEEEHINERVHWSAIAKRASGIVPLYNPRNLPTNIAAKKIAAITDEERVLLGAGD